MQGRTVKLAPSVRVYLLGAILSVALAFCSGTLGDRGGPSFIASSVVAGVAYLLAIREFLSTPAFPRPVVVFGITMAVLWQLAFLRMPSGPDDDIRRYVWDGHLQRLGYNPYTVVPSDPASADLHTAETRNLNNPNFPSPYPAGAQLFFRAITAIHESTFAMKVALVICGFAIIFILLDILRRDGRGSHLVLAYAWNPLLAIDVAGSGHIDIVGALLLLVSFDALERRSRAIAAITFGLAIAVKLLPVVLLPIYWKRVRIRDAVLAATVVALLYVPFLKQGGIPIGSLIAFVQMFRFNDPLFAQLEGVVPQIAAGLPVVFGFLIAARLRKTRKITLPEPSPDVFAWPMAASLLCAPTIYPWYLLWLLPFLRSVSTLPIVIWTVSIIPTYVVWHLRSLGRPWSVPGWILLLEYAPVAAAGVIITLRRLKRPDGP
jgi:hypothetical protein